MKNKKGQSLIEVIFSMGVVILVLVGVVMLMVVTAKAKRIAWERQKAIELSQLLIDEGINYLKDEDNSLNFWNSSSDLNNTTGLTETRNDFPGYSYNTSFLDCTSSSCRIVFTITWGDSQSLSVERLFSRAGL